MVKYIKLRGYLRQQAMGQPQINSMKHIEESKWKCHSKTKN